MRGHRAGMSVSPARPREEASVPRSQGNVAGRVAANGLFYAREVPLPLRLVAGSLLVTMGLALLVVALLGARSRLRRNRFAGVRTSATLRSDAAFTLANRAAAMPIGAAGVVAAAGGSVLLASGLLVRGMLTNGPEPVGWVVLAIAVVGCLMLTGLGGVVGDRVAAHLAARAPEPPTCVGACAGCDLAAGCRPDP